MIDDFNADQRAAFSACMAGKGYPGADTSLVQSSGWSVLANTPLHPASKSDATRDGLGLLRGLQAADETLPPPNRPPFQEIPISAFEGCEGSTGTEGLQDLIDSYRSEVLDDSLLAEARERWSSCIHDAGYGANGIVGLRTEVLPPQDANKRIAAQDDPKTRDEFDSSLMDKERHAALSVVTCDESAYGPVLGNWKRLEARWMDEHADRIDQLPDYQQTLWASNFDL